MAASSPEQRVALTESAWAAYAAGDIAGILEVFDPDIVVEVPPGLANSGTFRGHEGFLGWLAAWNEAWESFDVDVLETVAVGDHHVVCHLRQTGVGRGSGIEVSQQSGWMFEVRDLRTVYMQLHPDFDAALAAAREREGAADGV